MVQMKTDQQRTLGSLNSAVWRKVYQLNQMKTETAYKEYLLTQHLGILAPKVSELARKHDTPYSTLNHRIAGRGTKAEAADEWRLIPVASEAALVCNKTGRWPALFLTLSLTLWRSLHYLTLLYITLGRSFHFFTLLGTLFFTFLYICALYGGRWGFLFYPSFVASSLFACAGLFLTLSLCWN